jgi:hypothetical protein
MDSIPDVRFGSKAETQIWIDRSFFLNPNSLIYFAASNMFLSSTIKSNVALSVRRFGYQLLLS